MIAPVSSVVLSAVWLEPTDTVSRTPASGLPESLSTTRKSMVRPAGGTGFGFGDAMGAGAAADCGVVDGSAFPAGWPSRVSAASARVPVTTRTEATAAQRRASLRMTTPASLAAAEAATAPATLPTVRSGSPPRRSGSRARGARRPWWVVPAVPWRPGLPRVRSLAEPAGRGAGFVRD